MAAVCYMYCYTLCLMAAVCYMYCYTLCLKTAVCYMYCYTLCLMAAVCYMFCYTLCLMAADRLVGLVVKASASRAEGPGFESRLRRDFFGAESYQ